MPVSSASTFLPCKSWALDYHEAMEYKTLNNGMKMPVLGIGTFLIDPEPCFNAVVHALQHGYRLVDTANFYGNEKAVGRALRSSEVAREEIFLTSKIWPSDFGKAKTPQAIDATLQRLQVDYIDLLILHQPVGRYLEAYAALEEAVRAGKVKAIGLSNFYGKDLDKVLRFATIKPVLNTVECNPYYPQSAMKERLEKEGMYLESWFPLGQGDRRMAEEEVFGLLAAKYHKTPHQIILRWHIDRGYIVIPGSKTPAHIEDNIDLFDFALSEEDMAAIAALENKVKTARPPEWLLKLLLKFTRPNYKKEG